MDWTALTRTIAPTSAIMETADACKHLRIEHTDDDDYIDSLIEVATATIEGPNGIGIALATQTWKLRLDHLPRAIRIGLGPVQSIASITVDGETLDTALYSLSGDTVRGSYIPRPRADVVITFVAGYGYNIPADLIHAAKLIIGHLYTFREAAVAGGTAMEVIAIPMGVDAILERYRRY